MISQAELSRVNEIAFACGKKGSGKSKVLNDYFVQDEKKNPRVISLDFVGEVKERNPNAIEVVGYDALVSCIRELNYSDVRKWHIAAVFDQYKIEEGGLNRLFHLLCPPYDPKKMGLSKALGGLALECSECDVILPNGRASVEARNLIQRGRHEKLNMYFATRRPQECDRLCTSQADFIIAFRMHEPREMKFLADSVSQRFADAVRVLEQYNSAWYYAPTGDVEIRNKDGETIREFNVGQPEQTSFIQRG